MHKQAQVKKNRPLQLPRSMYMYLTRDVCSHSCFQTVGCCVHGMHGARIMVYHWTGMITIHTHSQNVARDTEKEITHACTHTHASYHCPLSTVLCPSPPYPPVCSLPFFDLVPTLKTDICLKRERQLLNAQPTLFILSSPSWTWMVCA